jgi:hypothetical protein
VTGVQTCALPILNAELEDWKISMEEYGDGTRVFARFQILIRK